MPSAARRHVQWLHPVSYVTSFSAENCKLLKSNTVSDRDSCHVYSQPTRPLLLTDTAVVFTVSLHYHCYWQRQPSCLQLVYITTVSDRDSRHVYSQPTLPLFLTETAIVFTVSLHYHCFWQRHLPCLQSACGQLNGRTLPSWGQG